MTDYTCDKCNKNFKQKSDYERHINKKSNCVPQNEIKKTENENLAKLETLFNKLRDILRDNESIVGKDALDVISDFLIIRLLSPLLKKNNDAPYIDLLEQKYSDKCDKYKQYLDWPTLAKKARSIKGEKDKQELLDIVKRGIFEGVFKEHDSMREIFKNKIFPVKKMSTVIEIIKELDKINFDEIDVDIKGKAYELTIQKEASTNKDFGQFFTPRWVVKYMAYQLNPKIYDDGSYDKIMDPACGTAGFITEYYKHIKRLAKEKGIIIDQNAENYLNGYEIVPKTRELAIINLLLGTGVYNKNIKLDDFLRDCTEYCDKKFEGHILTNPPFSLEKNYSDLCVSHGKKDDERDVLVKKNVSCKNKIRNIFIFTSLSKCIGRWL